MNGIQNIHFPFKAQFEQQSNKVFSINTHLKRIALVTPRSASRGATL